MRKKYKQVWKNICLDVFAFLLPFFSFSCLLKDSEFCSTNIIILDILWNLKLLCIMWVYCMMRDVWRSRIEFCKILPLWVDGRPEMNYSLLLLLYLWAKYEPIWLNFIVKTLILSKFKIVYCSSKSVALIITVLLVQFSHIGSYFAHR